MAGSTRSNQRPDTLMQDHTRRPTNRYSPESGPLVETDRRHSLHGPVLRIRSPSATLAPTCRWRSRPQHQKQTKCAAANNMLLERVGVTFGDSSWEVCLALD
jgi:hypothetical protein